MVQKKPELTLKEALQHVDYKAWFSDKVARDYVSYLENRFQDAGIEERAAICDTRAALMSMYSFLIYKLYPAMPRFKKEIDSSAEYMVNFASMKRLLDRNGGSDLAEECAKAAEANFGGIAEEVS
jgi:hypothetical protein